MQILLLEDKLTRFLDLSIPQDFGTDCDEDLMYADDIFYEIKKLNPEARVCNGISKMAIVDPSSAYVIKIPFNGKWCRDYDSEEDDDFFFEPFSNSGSQWDCTDYCLAEVEIYTEMEKMGFAEFFAKTEYYGETKTGYPTYIQEKIITVREDSSSRTPTNKAKSTILNSDELRYVTDSIWMALAIDYYGEEKVAKFIELISDDGPFNVVKTDLHRGNIGFRADGSPAILDYSGWGD